MNPSSLNNLTNRPSRNAQPRRMLVVGATGGTGRATVQRLRDLGHSVTAFSRSADRLAGEIEGIVTINGDAADAVAVERAVRDQDAVIVTLGIAENPLRVRLFGPARTPLDVRSRGTRNVLAAMRKHGVRRLVVLSSFGVGATRRLLGFVDRLLFALLLKPQIRDTELQEELVRADQKIDWTLVQPVHLTDALAGTGGGASVAEPFVSVGGETRAMRVTRESVARVLARAAEDASMKGQSLAVSG